MFSTRPQKKLIVPQGGFVVVDRDNVPEAEIVSPNIQNCILVTLSSKKGIALTHIDPFSPISARKVVQDMIDALREIHAGSDLVITAELIGGDFGFPCLNSSNIYQAIKGALESENIRYSHKVWNQNYSIVFVLAGMSLLPFFPLAAASLFAAFSASTLFTFVNAPVYNVFVNTKTLETRVIKSTLDQADLILTEAKENLPEFGAIFRRYKEAQDQGFIRIAPIPR